MNPQYKEKAPHKSNIYRRSNIIYVRLISFKSSSLKSLVFAYFLTYNPN